MADNMRVVRRWYAEELRYVASIKSTALVDAFAAVLREVFLGPGPWRVRGDYPQCEFQTTDDADPQRIYHNVLVALDEARGINNGLPSLWAGLLDQLAISPGDRALHLCCGTGYYTAILAELVGPHGRVTAIELDERLGQHAREALGSWPQVIVTIADATTYRSGPVDLIVASAGATHPSALWLDILEPGGRLLLPLTCDDRGGAMLLLTRQRGDEFAARFIRRAGFIEFIGARDPDASRLLEAAFARGDMSTVRSLRRDAHIEDATCWLHGGGYCLSRTPPPANSEPWRP
jgi:protein-L-isoaspartate(D-aspartate) O-methyltransferase